MNFCFPDKMITNCENNILEDERNLKISLKENSESIENIDEQGANNEDNTKTLSIDKLIKEHIFKTDNPSKLAWLISKIMKDVISEDYFVTEKQLKYLSTPKVSNRYRTFKIKKKNGGIREINAPANKLNKILYALNLIFKSLYSPHEAVCGFTEGKSIRDNALKHVGHHYVFNIDLKDFFTSIPQARIWARIQCAPFNFSPSVANIVAGLCCVYNEELGKNVLPQGAPTSPLLTNAICDKMDRKLAALAKKYGLHYSRYADDITFSSMHNVYQEESEFRKEMKNIIEGQGFCLNDKKTRLLKSGQRQEVTGLTVNSKVNVTRKYVKDLRCLLHIWETKGYDVAYGYFYPLYKKEKGHIKKGEPVMENVIGGKLNYLRMIKGESNACYQKLQQRYDKLQKIIYIDNNINKDITFVYQQFVLQDFEKNFSTKISLQISSRKKLIGKCNILGTEKMLPIILNTQKKLCPNLNTLTVGDSVNSSILKDCYVSLCCQRGRNFWLISHKQLEGSKYLTIPDIKINPDILLKKWEENNLKIVAWKFYFDILKKTINSSSFEKIIQEFICFVTHNKHFNNRQKLQVAKLLARDCTKLKEKENDIFTFSQGEEKTNNPRSVINAEYISPKELQKFLIDYNQDDILKYTCHPIDSEEIITDINNKCGTKEYSVEKHSKLINERFEERFKNFSGSKNMIGLIRAYLSGTNKWSSEKVEINWDSPELIKWSKENPGKVASPGKNIAKGQKNNGFRLSKAFISPINNRRVASFTELVIYFKTLIHIRRDNSLKDNIEVANKKINDIEVSFSNNFNEGIELFTDVDKLLQAYKKIIRICKECSKNKEIPKFEISFYKDERSVYLCIHHINTKYGKTLSDSLNRIGEGQAALIKNQINGLCDLYIEADFGESEYARINLWDGSDLTSEQIPEMQGVKYILKF